VEYSWLPPKCSLCAGFGHAAYACSRKSTKVWLSKGPPNAYKKSPFKIAYDQKKTAPVQKSFDKAVRRPSSNSKQKSKAVGVNLSNYFDPIGRIVVEDGTEEQFRPGPPPTLLDVFESALSSRKKGQCSSAGGGSPTTEI